MPVNMITPGLAEGDSIGGPYEACPDHRHEVAGRDRTGRVPAEAGDGSLRVPCVNDVLRLR